MSSAYEAFILGKQLRPHVPTAEEIARFAGPDNARAAAAHLAELEPGRQPLELFTQLSRLTVASTVEVVPLRERDDGPEVWLSQRSGSDPWWPNKWTLPGVVILPTDARNEDNSLAGPVGRLFDSELEGIQRTGDLHQLPSQLRHDGRGAEVTTQFWTTVEAEDGGHAGEFYSVAALREHEPEGGVLEEGWLTIDRAVAEYDALQADGA